MSKDKSEAASGETPEQAVERLTNDLITVKNQLQAETKIRTKLSGELDSARSAAKVADERASYNDQRANKAETDTRVTQNELLRLKRQVHATAELLHEMVAPLDDRSFPLIAAGNYPRDFSGFRR